MRIAKVKTVSSPNGVFVTITSSEKPEISEEIQNKWQKIVDLAAQIIGVPSGLITRLSENKLEVFLTSKTKNNIFQKNLKLDLGLGWYCENVAGTRSEFVVSNALKKDNWRENPSVPFKMISYMGMPILWPDGEVFGTFCMLDNKENSYSDLYKDLLKSLREIIQNDLKFILLYEQAKNDIFKKEIQLKEINHRVKNHFNLLIGTISLHSTIDACDKDFNRVLSEIQSKINVISLIHDKLSSSIYFDRVFIGEYLTELGRSIIENFSGFGINFSCSSPEINIKTTSSVSCGLILNELITNSLKYAFNNIDSPEINVTIKKNKNNDITFSYKDNGNGLPSDYDYNNFESLGMMLIKLSVEQLDGDFQIKSDNGFHFKMTFKIPD